MPFPCLAITRDSCSDSMLELEVHCKIYTTARQTQKERIRWRKQLKLYCSPELWEFNIIIIE